MLTREFIDSLLARCLPIPESGCLIWEGRISDGYGYIWLNGHNFRVHRLVYEYFNGPLPRGLMPDHLCRVRSCANHHHMEPVTNRVNVLRGIGPTAIAARKTHCQNGHPFTSENLGTPCKSSGHIRVCKKCAVIRQTRYRARKVEYATLL